MGIPTREAIQAWADDIASKFDVEKIILFGSQAHGTATEDSDVDVLVLMNSAQRPIEDAVAIACATMPPFACDILIRDPETAIRRYGFHDPFIRDAFDRGVVLYERSLARLA